MFGANVFKKKHLPVDLLAGISDLNSLLESTLRITPIEGLLNLFSLLVKCATDIHMIIPYSNSAFYRVDIAKLTICLVFENSAL